MSDKGQDQARKQWWRRLTALSAAAGGTALAVLVTWAVTYATSSVDRNVAEANPVRWTVETNPARVGAFSDMSIDVALPAGSRPGTGPGQGCTQFMEWVRSAGGVDAGSTHLQVFVTNNTNSQLLISDARATVHAEQVPLSPAGLRCPTAGEAEYRSLVIDLDKPDPRARYASPSGRKFGFALGPGESENFLIVASARRVPYSWKLALDVAQGDKRTTVIVDDDGKPFITVPARAHYWEWNGHDAWISQDERTVSPGGRLDGS